MRHLVYSVRYSMITINSSLLSIALNSSVIKTPVYNDTEYLNDVITEPVFLGLTGYYDNDNEFVYIYCAVLKRLTTPSDFHIPLPSIVPFAHSWISFIHACIYYIFPRSPGTASFFPFLWVSSES